MRENKIKLSVGQLVKFKGDSYKRIKKSLIFPPYALIISLHKKRMKKLNKTINIAKLYWLPYSFPDLNASTDTSEISYYIKYYQFINIDLLSDFTAYLNRTEKKIKALYRHKKK
jgi:hypothetical protein